jgi:hypothetical protein
LARRADTTERATAGREILSEVVAYGAAVAAASAILVFVIGVYIGDAGAFSYYPLVAIVMLLFALPGTLVARLVLGWRKSDGFLAYSAAGATVGLVTGVLPEAIGGGWFWRDDGPMAVAMGLSGLAGGGVLHAVQRLHRPMRVAPHGLTSEGRGRE